ncbi:2'-5' RNA ligase [Kushneria sinocarnis]|uniref:RNA 2',3'-cyclic phosphodiesterase n=1 Tax=Kushneria sinocarnis TaxID=595502 RepID=A0A420WY32_9GAMM|nr:RNA 2',3'-cyclic phosphodiesterase [Kushneria sinocarnis]RKR06137.1 2'-5' RNA ligase [Kushneria sinocarnis]
MSTVTDTGQHRLFLALMPDEATRRAMLRLRSRALAFDFPESSRAIRWVPPRNWHVTLAFLGSCSPDTRQQLSALGQQMFEGFRGARATARELQGFPDPDRPGRTWTLTFTTTAMPSDEAATPQSWHRHLLEFPEIAGLANDRHDFRPHITLARSRNPEPWPRRDVSMQCHFDRIALLESIIAPEGGSTYQPLSVAGASL